jgi:pilus assembly protein CpaE
LIAFVADGTTEATLREGLVEAAPAGLDIRRGGLRAAIASMERDVSPKVLIVDVGEEEQPLAALAHLSEVVEPDVAVLVIGKPNDLDFYRAVTRGLGAREYLARPLGRDAVARHFAPIVAGSGPSRDGVMGGRIITVTGARGGVGASTIAVNLAWHFGVIARRHTVLLDADLHTGTAAFLLDLRPGPGLRIALESPGRIDALLAERMALPAADRLHVLAGEEDLATPAAYTPGTAAQLLDALCKRYNFIVADVPYRPLPLFRELLEGADQRVLVMEASLAAVRDTLRLLALPNGVGQAGRAIVVLNRAGSGGGLSPAQIENALGGRVDVQVPNLPRHVGNAATLGQPAASNHVGFRNAIAALARQAGAVRLLEASAEPAPDARTTRRRWWRRFAHQ